MINTFWTGGWDSTYRILNLVFDAGERVQPHYVANPARGSQDFELKSMNAIRAAANERLGTEMVMAPKVTPLAEIPVSEYARRQHKILVERFNIGPQYLWLAEYVRYMDLPNVELCVHVDDKAYALLKWFESGAAEEDRTVSEAIREQFLARFSFPVLDRSKVAMLSSAREAGFESLMDLTWFCQMPTPEGDPCGFCNPCQWTIDEGLKHRVPRVRRLRLGVYRGIVKRIPSYRVRQFGLRLLQGGDK